MEASLWINMSLAGTYLINTANYILIICNGLRKAVCNELPRRPLHRHTHTERIKVQQEEEGQKGANEF